MAELGQSLLHPRKRPGTHTTLPRPSSRTLLIASLVSRSSLLSRYADNLAVLPFFDNPVFKSAHTNICRVQGDPSVPFKLENALPGLDPWYRPYLSLLEQVGSHLNHFEPELGGNPSLNNLGPADVAYHLARLRLLVENAGINIVQVPTLTENTGSQRKPSPPTEREFLLASQAHHPRPTLPR